MTAIALDTTKEEGQQAANHLEEVNTLLELEDNITLLSSSGISPFKNSVN